MNVESCMKKTKNICKNDAITCNSGSCILNCSLINYRCHRKQGNAETERHKNCDKYEKGGREKNGMLKGIRKIMTFLLMLAVVLSFICQTDPQIFAQSPDVTDDEAEVAVQSDETALPEDEQAVGEETQEEVTKEEMQEETPAAETMQMQNTDVDEHQGMATEQAEADPTDGVGNSETSTDEAGSISVTSIIIDPESHFTLTCRF